MIYLYLIFILGIALIVLYSFYYGKNAVIKRELKKNAITPVADVKQGATARITGRAQLVDEPLIAPLSGRECCFYHLEVKENKGDENTNWVTIINVSKAAPYVVNDNGSYAFINSARPRAHIVKDYERSSCFGKDATAQLENILKQHGQKSENWLGMNRDLRYEEGIIEHGETITALGIGDWYPAEKLNLPAHYGNVLSISADPQLKFVYLSDDTSVVG